MRRIAAGMTKPGRLCVQYPGREAVRFGGRCNGTVEPHGLGQAAGTDNLISSGPAVSGAGADSGGVRAGDAVQRQLCGGPLPARGCLCLHPAPAAVCGAGPDRHVAGQPGGLPYLSQAGLAGAGGVPGAAGAGFVHAGIQRLQALAGDPRGGNITAQRNRKVRGGAGFFPYYFPQCQPDEKLFGGGAALWPGAGDGGGIDAAGTPPVGHPADSGHWGGADVCGRHRDEMVHPGGCRGGGRRGRGSGRHARPGALCRQPAGLLAGPLCRPAGGRPSDHPEPVCHRLGRGRRPGFGQQPPETYVCAGTPERLYLFHCL